MLLLTLCAKTMSTVAVLPLEMITLIEDYADTASLSDVICDLNIWDWRQCEVCMFVYKGHFSLTLRDNPGGPYRFICVCCRYDARWPEEIVQPQFTSDDNESVVSTDGFNFSPADLLEFKLLDNWNEYVRNTDDHFDEWLEELRDILVYSCM